MNGYTEIIYWMKNDDWYHIDRVNDTFIMNDNAPLRAKRSFIMWSTINGYMDDKIDKFINDQKLIEKRDVIKYRINHGDLDENLVRFIDSLL